jgi:LacI family transcriptional regulator
MDDDEYARRAEVPLTTVRQPFEDIGARGAHLLIDMIRGGSGKIERVLLPTQLVIRRSCGAALFHPQSTKVSNES